MHVLVTGAGGFSGSHLVEGLLAQGHRVTAVVGSRRGRLREDAQRPGEVKVLYGDLAGDLALPDQIDAVIHAAARSPAPGVNAARIVHDNIVATQRLIQESKRSGARLFVFLSSLSVHGRIERTVVDENTPIVDPDVYGLTKRVGEELLAAEADTLRSLSIRLPGVLGRGSVRNWLTGVLATARLGREIAVYNPDAPFNNAVHIDDLVAFVLGLLSRKWDGADAVALAAGGQITVRQAVQSIVNAFGARSTLRVVESGKSSFLVSSARARERYGYAPMEIGDTVERFAAESR